MEYIKWREYIGAVTPILPNLEEVHKHKNAFICIALIIPICTILLKIDCKLSDTFDIVCAFYVLCGIAALVFIVKDYEWLVIAGHILAFMFITAVLLGMFSVLMDCGIISCERELMILHILAWVTYAFSGLFQLNKVRKKGLQYFKTVVKKT